MRSPLCVCTSQSESFSKLVAFTWKTPQNSCGFSHRLSSVLWPYAGLTGIHLSHLSTDFLLFHYEQISPGQNLSPLKPVAKLPLFVQDNMHSESLQGKRER